LSPQKIFNKKKGTFGQYQGDEESFRLIFNDNPPIDIPYYIRSSLPIGYARTGPDLHPQVNTVLSIENQNMPDSQKLLLDWQNRFAHLNFARVQQVLRHIPFIANMFGDATSVTPQCAIPVSWPNPKEDPRNHHFKQKLQKEMEHSKQEISKLEPEFL
jgi:hypothetical protein